MLDALYSIDVALFFFLNRTIANPVFDILFPFLTDLNKQPFIGYVLIAVIGWVLWKGGAKGRITVLLLVIGAVIGDQLSSSVLKPIFGRIRPCRALEGVRMLVDCGSGLSFPSSHAVNNFTGAAIISFFYRRQTPYWMAFASLMALSRPYVGVHYPSDILGGAVTGAVIGLSLSSAARLIAQRRNIIV
ncbi:MAG: phosphatase PAP2 family protein [Bacteroidetes bacterium]|nr:MAG: phosphatase PAP2 family protein [Bacteroidota bacterium]